MRFRGAAGLLFAAASRLSAATFTVTYTDDSGPGSLRQALLDAAATAGFDTIAFAIPGAGVHTITAATPLPLFSEAALIDGYSQPGASENTHVRGLHDADWIEELAAQGITTGCGGGNFCPNNLVTRRQMAVFLLKTKYGSTYVPPACTGVFDDVACPGGAAVDFIERLAAEQITGGCSAMPPLYCPDNSSTRGQMAVFIVKTFGLQ